MNIKIAVLFFVLCFCVSGLRAEEAGMLFQKPKHIIYLIHGIGGNKTHFGYMSKALSIKLKHEDPATKYIIRSIEYDTGDNEKTPYDFAKDIHAVIAKATDKPDFSNEDKISLIMHSQGGLIGSIWMFQSLMSTEGYGTPETIRHLDAFITLGTPFWGAKTAKWGHELKTMTDHLGVKVPLPFGKRELEQMTFGSDMIFDFRMAMIDPQFEPIIKHLKENVRFLNIVGVADLLNPLGIFVSGTGKYEDDGAVPLSSARFNFLYSQDLRDDYAEGIKTSLDNVKEVDMAPYVVVNAMHRSPLPELDNFAGIPQIPRKCIKGDQCHHPTFPYLWNHIMGNPIRQIDGTLGDFKAFLIDLNVRIDSEENYPCEDINIEFLRLDGSQLEGSNIEVSKFFEFYSSGMRKSSQNPNHCRSYTTGSIKRSMENRKEALLIKIAGRNLKARFVEMKLKESYSSFADINMIEQMAEN